MFKDLSLSTLPNRKLWQSLYDETEESPSVAVFDFDGTLSILDFHGLAPDHGLAFAREASLKELEDAFGGAQRVLTLGHLLLALSRRGVHLEILSFSLRDVIVVVLERFGWMGFFREIYGRAEMCGQPCGSYSIHKQEFMQIRRRNLSLAYADMIFVDDRLDHIRYVAWVCR